MKQPAPPSQPGPREPLEARPVVDAGVPLSGSPLPEIVRQVVVTAAVGAWRAVWVVLAGLARPVGAGVAVVGRGPAPRIAALSARVVATAASGAFRSVTVVLGAMGAMLVMTAAVTAGALRRWAPAPARPDGYHNAPPDLDVDLFPVAEVEVEEYAFVDDGLDAVLDDAAPDHAPVDDPYAAGLEDPRPWPMKAGNVLIGSLAGIVAVFMVVGALGPKVVSDVAGAVEMSLVLPENSTLGGLAERSVIYAADGSVLTVLHGEVDRNPVSMSQIPDHVWQAVVASEDRRFFTHEGYDVEGFGRAMLVNIRARGVAEGGSTITQQLAKMNFVGNEETLQRKLQELVYAVKLEQELPKEQLLERYLNQVYFGAGAYGIQAAAEEYFRVNVGDLTPNQGALLAAMIPNPSARNPRTNPEVAREERDSVLSAMEQVGYLSPNELPVLKAQPVEVAPPRSDVNREPYVIEAVKREFFSNPAFGATREERIDRLFQGGLEIHTTIEPRLQEVGREVVEDFYPEAGGPTAAIAAVDPATGAIKAIHSGQEFQTEQYDIATQGRRQPGSSFKTFVMAEALRQGFPPDLVLDGSSPIEVIYDEGRQIYEPQNYGGADYGDIDMRTALRNSVNTYFVQLFVLAGEENAVQIAGEMGVDVPRAIGTRADYGPSLTLGGLLNGVTPLEMASAYSVFANEGVRQETFLIDRVLRHGDDILRRRPREHRVLDADVNGVAVDMLRAVVEGGTGTRAALSGWQVAGKTGTTNDNTDAWFVGTTPVMSTAVWVGHPEGQVEMPGATGGQTAAPVWQAFMSRALDGVEPVPFPEYDAPSFTGAEVDVPDVRGLTQAEALQELAAVKLVGDSRSVNSHAPAGRVVWQDPAPSVTFNAGDTVVMGVSNGTPPPPPPPPPEPEPEPEPEATEPDDAEPEEPAPEETEGEPESPDTEEQGDSGENGEGDA